MPLPKPNENEKEQAFVSRCMGNPTMNKEYPDQKQRAAICYSQFRRKKAKGSEPVWEEVEAEIVDEALKAKGIFAIDIAAYLKGLKSKSQSV